MDRIDLSQVAEGETVMIAAVDGGRGLAARLAALGITAGAVVTKVSAQLLRGPVIVQRGRTRVAIGYGMARRILVKRRREP